MIWMARRCGMIRVISDPDNPKRTDSFENRYCGTLNKPLLFNRQAVPCRSCEINLKINLQISLLFICPGSIILS